MKKNNDLILQIQTVAHVSRISISDNAVSHDSLMAIIYFVTTGKSSTVILLTVPGIIRIKKPPEESGGLKYSHEKQKIILLLS